jgi:hypothetical protein
MPQCRQRLPANNAVCLGPGWIIPHPSQFCLMSPPPRGNVHVATDMAQ